MAQREQIAAQADQPKLNLLIGWFTEKQLAAELGICLNTLRYWHARGKGPARAKFGSRIYYQISVVEQWMREQQERPPTRRSRKLVAGTA